MSKTLLSESEIKDFMKYANLGQDTTRNFLGRLNEHSLAEAMPGEEEEAEGPEGEEMPMPGPEEGGEEEGMPEEGAEEEGMEAAVEKVVSAIVDAIGEIPGAPEISMEAGEEGMPEEGMPEEGGEEEGMPPEGGEGEEAPEAEGGEEEEALMESLRLYLEELEDESDAFLAENVPADDYPVDDEAGGMEGEWVEDEEEFGDEGYEDEEEAAPGLEEEMYEGYEDLEEDAGLGLDEEELVNEVTRRVAGRILNARKRRRKRK